MPLKTSPQRKETGYIGVWKLFAYREIAAGALLAGCYWRRHTEGVSRRDLQYDPQSNKQPLEVHTAVDTPAGGRVV